MNENSLLPTNKLLSAAVTALILYVLSLIVAVDAQLEQAVNVIVPLIVAYFVKNAQTPGGVPVKTPAAPLRSERGYGLVELVVAVLLVLILVFVLLRLV